MPAGSVALLTAATSEWHSEPQAAEQHDRADADEHCRQAAIDIPRRQEHGRRDGQPHRGQAGDRHDAGNPDEVLLLIAPEHQAVVGDGPSSRAVDSAASSMLVTYSWRWA